MKKYRVVLNNGRTYEFEAIGVTAITDRLLGFPTGPVGAPQDYVAIFPIDHVQRVEEADKVQQVQVAK